jgi:hypothetical protein
MLLRLTSPTRHGLIGQVVTVPDGEAEWLVNAGHAALVIDSRAPRSSKRPLVVQDVPIEAEVASSAIDD